MLADGLTGDYSRYANGLAWAARRELLAELTIYDRCILGSGDRAFSSACFGCFDHLNEYAYFGVALEQR